MPSTYTCPQCRMTIVVPDGATPACPNCSRDNATLPPRLPNMSMPPPPPTSVAIQAAAQMTPGNMHHALNYMAMVQTLRGIGIGNIILGVILLGISLLMQNAAGIETFPVFIIIGLSVCVVLICEGIWLIAAPSSAGMLVAAISMFVVGILFLNGIVVLLILGFYGYSLIKRYMKHGDALNVIPSQELQKEAAGLLNMIRKANPKKTADLIEINTSEAFVNRKMRGILFKDSLILVALEARLFGTTPAEAYYLSPSAIRVDIEKKFAIGKGYKVNIFIDNQKIKGKISEDFYNRFSAWQRASVVLPPPVQVPVQA